MKLQSKKIIFIRIIVDKNPKWKYSNIHHFFSNRICPIQMMNDILEHTHTTQFDDDDDNVCTTLFIDPISI